MIEYAAARVADSPEIGRFAFGSLRCRAGHYKTRRARGKNPINP
jgi:hypothetical protein